MDFQSEIERLTVEISFSESADLYFQRGKIYWKIGQRAAALTDLNKAVSLDPDSGAKDYLAMLNDIMDFYDTDQWNP